MAGNGSDATSENVPVAAVAGSLTWLSPARMHSYWSTLDESGR